MSAFASLPFATLAITVVLAAALPASAQEPAPARAVGSADSAAPTAALGSADSAAPVAAVGPAESAAPAVGVSFERFMFADDDYSEGVTLMTFHAAGLRPGGGVGVDVAVSAVPEALLHGAFIGVGDIGPAFSTKGKQSTLLLRTGFSVIGCACEGGAAAFGGYLGAAGLFRTGRRVGLRVDVTPRVFLQESAYLTWTIGFGITSLPPVERILARKL